MVMGAEGWSSWLWNITPAHLAWVALAVAGLWVVMRIDWLSMTDRPEGRLAWEAAKAAGVALGLKYAVSSGAASLRGLGPVLDLLR